MVRRKKKEGRRAKSDEMKHFEESKKSKERRQEGKDKTIPRREGKE